MQNVSTTGSKIRWTEAEKATVARELVILSLNDPLGNPIDRLRKAQLALPVERRRSENSLASLTMVPEIVELFRAIWLENVTAPPAPPEPTKVVSTVIEVFNVPEVSELLPKLDTVSLKTLLAEREELDRQSQYERLSQLITTGTQQPEPVRISLTKVPKFERERLPRVAVIGPLDSQFATLRDTVQKHGIRVDMREYDKDSHERPLTGDYIILWTKYISHRWQHEAHQALGRDRVYYVDGGIEAIVQKMRDIASMKVPHQ